MKRQWIHKTEEEMGGGRGRGDGCGLSWQERENEETQRGERKREGLDINKRKGVGVVALLTLLLLHIFLKSKRYAASGGDHSLFFAPLNNLTKSNKAKKISVSVQNC